MMLIAVPPDFAAVAMDDRREGSRRPTGNRLQVGTQGQDQCRMNGDCQFFPSPYTPPLHICIGKKIFFAH
jgi:hypothetical protein